ncbi:hypothetical protein CLOBOL_06298 [Enterocloster bolteae ATCC BAA-613]|uniref:Uncharacterized protein n=1 Tax=Enterocloster bolteae (strain ATCC BAA-613 / DSM 15670 / CCUG 46953 / JCM 12243 / WAL 16351) TaxID=411902 RepID=A8S272_ENTBW|nr:hypothetical protein CLOBOL_06298 [Enterocloster bolteae ATCC BAA-613]
MKENSSTEAFLTESARLVEGRRKDCMNTLRSSSLKVLVGFDGNARYSVRVLTDTR